ncbi:hypothetical protein [Pantoea sp. 18069]|uniref:hypothetical protein n=1 Tax=Pantoea sp. 18069 TaxID=2681415 RepID=UPI00135A81C6|nr:hypothetical protein [Pantoea sp. 18069]
MTTSKLSLKSWRARVAGAALAFVALAGAGAAQARDVVWSVGVHSPGVSLGVANTMPLVVASGPVYYAPPPVYYAPRPIYHAAPVVVMPPRHGYYGKHHYKHYDKHRGHGYRDHNRRHGHRGHGHR